METQNNLLNEQELRAELVQSFGLEALTEEDQNATLDKLMEALIKTIFLRTFDRLGDDGVAEYERLLERATGETEVAAFLEQKIPGYNVFVKEIVADFKESLTESLQE